MLCINKIVANQRGNIAMMFGLLLIPMVMAAGIAIDFTMREEFRADLQEAADAAALAAMSPFITDAQREDVGKRQFKSLVASRHIDHITGIDVDLSEANKVRVTATYDMPTSFMRIVGKKTMGVQVVSEVGRSYKRPEIVFVLDVSGSMSGRIGTLKTSAKRLVDLVDSNKPPGVTPKYGYVPFTENVNIGTDNDEYVYGDDHALFAGTSWAGCVLERASPGTNTDAYNGAENNPLGKWHAYISPPEPNRDGVCENPGNGENTGYASVVTNAPGVYTVNGAGPNQNCVRHPLHELTTNASAIKTAIDGLTTESNNGTVIAPGVAWGMRLLTPGEPFTDAEAFSADVRKIMIVLTDGEQTTEAENGSNLSCPADANTVSSYEYDPADFGLDGGKLTGSGPRDLFTPWGYILDSDPFGSNPVDFTDVKKDLRDISIDACDIAKNAGTGPDKGIEVFTIAVSSAAGPGTDVYELLQDCATDPDHFLYAENVADLEPTFENIAEKIISVYISK